MLGASVGTAELLRSWQGFEAAKAAGVEEVAVFAAASETFSRRNINCTVGESLKRFGDVVAAAEESGIAVRGYVSCVVNCPYEVLALFSCPHVMVASVSTIGVAARHHHGLEKLTQCWAGASWVISRLCIGASSSTQCRVDDGITAFMNLLQCSTRAATSNKRQTCTAYQRGFHRRLRHLHLVAG